MSEFLIVCPDDLQTDHIVDIPKVKSSLCIGKDKKGIQFNLLCNRPNWFWRMCQWLFLGFVWKEHAA
ncbi:hypothetical protein LCGC14_1501760 [marine sediment metagenome]|uniref:Uncharacterized protein n=1 Tax=marine sediment metagenome TaxID=412755 RepID=A0A0F9J3Y4_9ZZZZ